MKGLRRFRRICGAMALVFLFNGAAGADAVYTTADFMTGVGILGIIDSDLNARPLNIPTTSDAAVFSFLDGKESRVLLDERDTAGDSIIIYDPNGGWVASEIPNKNWNGYYNIHGIAASDGKLYAAIYGDLTNGRSSPVVAAPMPGYEPARSYCPDPSGGLPFRAEKILTRDGYIYALFVRGSTDYQNYENSLVLKLDADFSESARYVVGGNAVDMAFWNGRIAVACMGGTQAYGKIGGIDVIDLSKEPADAVTRLDLGADAGQIASLCAVGSDLYFIGTKVIDPSDWKTEGALYKWTGTTKEKLVSGSGYPTLLVYDPAMEAVVAALDADKVVILGLDGKEKKTFDNIDLKGNIYSLAVVEKAVAPELGGDSGGGGCDAGLTAFAALLLLLPPALRKKSR